MPPVNDGFLYPEERAAGLTAQKMYDRFRQYMTNIRELQAEYAPRFSVLAGFETEGYTGAICFAEKLREQFQPDYIVGSLHHVNDIPIDYTPAVYRQAAEVAGGTEALYCDYFDRQHELIRRLRPEVVGHFDLIRIFDPDYPAHLRLPGVRERIERNLLLIRELDLIMDLNVRAYYKGMDEPYISRPVLEQALALGIAVVPGDDSHGAGSVGQNLERGIAAFQAAGGNICWRKPCHSRQK